MPFSKFQLYKSKNISKTVQWDKKKLWKENTTEIDFHATGTTLQLVQHQVHTRLIICRLRIPKLNGSNSTLFQRFHMKAILIICIVSQITIMNNKLC